MKTGPKSKYTCNENFFSEETEETFYVAGFIAADGNIQYPTDGRKKILSIGLCCEDKNLLQKIKNVLKSTNPIHSYMYGNINSIRLTISSNKLCEDLYNYFNIMPNKTFIYSMPEKLLNHKLINHFIRGYIDGDGCFDNTNPKGERPYIRMRLLGTKKFLMQIDNILNRECNVAKRNIKNIKNIYEITYDGNKQVNKINNFLYKDYSISLERKHNLAMLSEPKPKGIKLSLKDVKIIRKLIAKNISIKNIAAKFGISPSSICDIKMGRTWSQW